MLMTIRPQMTDYWPNWTRMTELSALESEVLPHVLMTWLAKILAWTNINWSIQNLVNMCITIRLEKK